MSGPALSLSVGIYVGPWPSPAALCVGPRCSLCRTLGLCASGPALSVSGPFIRMSPIRFRSSWVPCVPVSDPTFSGPSSPVPPVPAPQVAGPQLLPRAPSSGSRATPSPARSLFPGENLKPYCLGDYCHYCLLLAGFANHHSLRGLRSALHL